MNYQAWRARQKNRPLVLRQKNSPSCLNGLVSYIFPNRPIHVIIVQLKDPFEIPVSAGSPGMEKGDMTGVMELAAPSILRREGLPDGGAYAVWGLVRK